MNLVLHAFFHSLVTDTRCSSDSVKTEANQLFAVKIKCIENSRKTNRKYARNEVGYKTKTYLKDMKRILVSPSPIRFSEGSFEKLFRILPNIRRLHMKKS